MNILLATYIPLPIICHCLTYSFCYLFVTAVTLSSSDSHSHLLPQFFVCHLPCVTYFTYALTLRAEYNQQITRLRPLICTAASIFIQLYLKPAVHIFSGCLFHIFYGFGVPAVVHIWHRSLHISTCVNSSSIFLQSL